MLGYHLLSDEGARRKDVSHCLGLLMSRLTRPSSSRSLGRLRSHEALLCGSNRGKVATYLLRLLLWLVGVCAEARPKHGHVHFVFS